MFLLVGLSRALLLLLPTTTVDPARRSGTTPAADCADSEDGQAASLTVKVTVEGARTVGVARFAGAGRVPCAPIPDRKPREPSNAVRTTGGEDSKNEERSENAKAIAPIAVGLLRGLQVLLIHTGLQSTSLANRPILVRIPVAPSGVSGNRILIAEEQSTVVEFSVVRAIRCLRLP